MKLGRYEIESELGRGAMGRVLLAHDPEIDRKVAIKIVQSLQGLAGADRGEARDRFLREARSAGKLLHPGIVTVFDVGEVQGTPYLAMEYVQGRTLDAYCRPDGLLPVRQAVEMVAGAAEALSYAHAAGVVHRDIKPANLMRTGESSVKIMDFGLARGAEAQVTHDGALLGTPSYMSPEQIRGRAVDGRSDLFSLGVVLYELLTGVKPFPGDSVSSVIYRVVHEQPHDAAEVNPRVPPALGRLLRRALDKRVDQRFQTGDELAAALRKIAATLDVAPGSAGGSDSGRPAGPAPPRRPAAGRSIPPSPRPTVKRSSPLPFVLAIAAVLALLAGGSYYYRKSLGFDGLFDRPPVVYQTRVTVEPAETAVTVNGEPFDPTGDGVVQFTAGGPPTTVIARHACREERHELGAEQAGGELAIVFEPVRLAYELALDGVGAEVELNGEPVGRTPVGLDLDLCRSNRIVLRAAGFVEASIEIPDAATPIEARTLLSSLALDPVPMGTLVFPETPVKLSYYLDGERVDTASGPLELPQGTHRLRATNDRYWIDVSRDVEISAGSEVEAAVAVPALTELVVFAYPPNAKVELRHPGGRWRYLDDVPLRYRIAAGRYEVRVTLKTTGETRTSEIVLEPGDNPEVRVSFGTAS